MSGGPPIAGSRRIRAGTDPHPGVFGFPGTSHGAHPDPWEVGQEEAAAPGSDLFLFPGIFLGMSGMGWGKGDNAPLQIPVSRVDPSDVEFHPGVWDGGIRNMPEIPLKSSTSLWNPEGVGSGASKPKISPEPGTEEAGFYFHGSSSRPCRSIPAP